MTGRYLVVAGLVRIGVSPVARRMLHEPQLDDDCLLGSCRLFSAAVVESHALIDDDRHSLVTLRSPYWILLLNWKSGGGKIEVQTRDQ